MSKIIQDKSEITPIINNQISDGENLLRELRSQKLINALELDWELWRMKTAKILESIDSSHAHSFLMVSELNKSFAVKQKVIELERVLTNAIEFLKRLITDMENGLYDIQQFKVIEQSVALEVVRRILNNFYKHLESMYQSTVHGNGTIKKEDLDLIKIGNEYDIQRILYALIRPIFPETRMEVTEDAGYRSIRSDIFLDEYNIAIEVKCTRTSMTIRNLTEELGADAFHYKSEYLFIFVYDKEKIILNIDAFKKAYKRDKKTFDKDVEAFVVQPITL